MNQKRAVISRISLLATLTNSEIDKAAELLDICCYENKEIIVEQGEKVDHVYCIIRGHVLASARDKHNHHSNLNFQLRYHENDVFNEQILITQSPFPYTVVSLGQVVCAKLSVSQFEQTLGSCMELLKRNPEIYHNQLHHFFGLTMTDADFQCYSARRHFYSSDMLEVMTTRLQNGMDGVIHKWDKTR